MWKFIYIFVVCVHVSIVSSTYDKTDDEVMMQSEQDSSQLPTYTCEYCDRAPSKKNLCKSKLSALKLCNACYKCERKYGFLIPRCQRVKNIYAKQPKLSSNICEYCNRASSKKHVRQSKFSEFKLCYACVKFERKYGFLTPLNERKQGVSKFNQSNICENCDRTSRIKHLCKSTTSELKLCYSCYQCEKKYGCLIPSKEKKYECFIPPREKVCIKKLSNICEYCDRISSHTNLQNSKTSEFKLCSSCYHLERKYGTFISSKIPLKENIYIKTLSNICEYCDRISSTTRLYKSKTSEFKVCSSCYQCERKNGCLILPKESYTKTLFNICEYCNRPNSYESLLQSKVYELKLCKACYVYERKFGKLIPPSEREKSVKQKKKVTPNICEYCDRPNSNQCLLQSKVYELKLCKACYVYERKHGKLKFRSWSGFRFINNLYKDEIQEKKSSEGEIRIIQKRNRDGSKKEDEFIKIIFD